MDKACAIDPNGMCTSVSILEVAVNEATAVVPKELTNACRHVVETDIIDHCSDSGSPIRIICSDILGLNEKCSRLILTDTHGS